MCVYIYIYIYILLSIFNFTLELLAGTKQDCHLRIPACLLMGSKAVLLTPCRAHCCFLLAWQCHCLAAQAKGGTSALHKVFTVWVLGLPGGGISTPRPRPAHERAL